MADIAVEFAKNEAQSFVNIVKKEAHYLCCFNSYVENFDQKKEGLAAKLQDVNIEIENASGVSRVKNQARQWVDEAEKLINVDTKKKEKCFNNLCLNCWWQYQRGKELEAKTLQIDQLLERSNFDIVAGSANIPSIKHRSLPNFMHFESRQSQFQDLKKALEDENCNMIGLHGLGGTGKTSMAMQMGAELEGSKFGKVIPLVVSKPPDFKKLRGEIARHLNLNLEDEKKEQWQIILSKITEMKESLLIILDDVWEKFDLRENLGIPTYHDHKGCSVLITTRKSHVCAAIGCQREIHLETLNETEALTLFLTHASINDSSSLKGVARNILKHCHGVPVVIVAVASTLKGQPPKVWNATLRTLRNARSVLDTDNEDLKKGFEGLKLSYDNLKNDKAKELFLISSLFPEDFEIPLELLSIVGVGMGPFREVDEYNERRSKVDKAIAELLDSSLLLNYDEEYVKMHDLVHEVALLIGDKDIQLIVDSKVPIKQDLRYLCWKNDEFPNGFDAAKLEFLLLLLDLEGSKDLDVLDSFIVQMTKLKVLLLFSTSYRLISAPSLFHSLQSLEDIRTLALVNLKLCDISILGNLSSLESLWLHDCSIIQLPVEILKLKKLNFLEVVDCKIAMDNPFEVIERCSQLQELTFVHNEINIKEEDLFPQNISPPTLLSYQITSRSSYYLRKFTPSSRFFDASELVYFVSVAMFKQLAGTAEVLLLDIDGMETKWKNLIPDIISMRDGGMNDLIFLYLCSCSNMQYLIDVENHYSDVKALSNLVELHLSHMDVEDLYRGTLPSGFLEQLKILTLKQCQKLKKISFNESLNLRNLNTMELEHCPMLTSIFQPSTAQSLIQLEELKIKNCDTLEYIIIDKNSGGGIVNDDGDNDQKSYGSLFPKLKSLQIEGCDKLKIILPVLFVGGLPRLEEISICKCEQLKYIFNKFHEGDHSMLPSLRQMELYGVPSLIGLYQKPMSLSMQKLGSPTAHAFSWAQACCFLSKSRAASEETNAAVSKAILLDLTTPQGLLASRKWCVGRQLLNFCHVKNLNFGNLSLNSASLFNLSIASMIMWEELSIMECVGLKHIITSEADDYNDQINYISIFPKLEKLEIGNCKDLEVLFLSTMSVIIENLKSLTIKGAPKLNFVVGKYHDHSSNPNHNGELHFDLPALKNVVLEDCDIKSSADSNVRSYEGQLNSNAKKALHASNKGFETADTAQIFLIQPWNNIRKMEFVNCSKLISLSTLSIASTIMLKDLTIQRCRQLKCIVTDVGNAQVHKNYYSIFSELKNLEIVDCDKLEFLFPHSLSIELKNLRSLTIKDAQKLEYVVAKCQQEQYLSNDELHFDLPALEILCFEDVPKIISICPINYKMAMSSLQRLVLKNCGFKAFKELRALSDRAPPFDAAQSLLMQSLKNVRKIELVNCWNLISLSALHIASVISLENLTIHECHRLKCIVADEGDAQVVQMNYCSIFPRLENLDISNCKGMEFLFPSTISGALKNLKSLIITEVPELKYVVGKYQQDPHLSNQNRNDELHFDLAALQYLCVKDAPKMSNICPMNYNLELSPLLNVILEDCSINANLTVRSDEEQLMNWKTTKELHGSIVDGAPPFHVVQSIFIPSLKNIREIVLVNCWNLTSLSTLSNASTILLEKLRISSCQNLKCILADEGYARVHMNYCSIFPRLENLEILCCWELEFLFQLRTSGGLENLKLLTIDNAPKLQYVGKYNHEHHVSNQNGNDELHFDLPALQLLNITDAPKMCNICTMNYNLISSSLQNAVPEDCSISTDLTVCSEEDQLNWKNTKEEDAAMDVIAPFLAAQSLSIQSLNNIKEMKLVGCSNLVSLLTLSIASTILLENLTIERCHQLKCIVANEEDALVHMNQSSIFPKLKELEVSHCNALEYLFPAFAFTSPVHLKTLIINFADELKYVFGRSHQEDNLSHANQNIHTYLDFPALETLFLGNVQNLISICPRKYCLRGLSLKSIALIWSSQFTIRSVTDFMVSGRARHEDSTTTKAIETQLQTLESLRVCGPEIEEVFNLTHMALEKNWNGLKPLTSSLNHLMLQYLSELRYICAGPKNILMFDKLYYLKIKACRKLKVVFSASILRSLPALEKLVISKCEELIHIIEEDNEENSSNHHLRHKPCFPNLSNLIVKHCNKLKYLLSITMSGILPKLSYLSIKDSSDLEHVLIRQDETEEMAMKDVLPRISHVEIDNLPNLNSVCLGIDFCKLENCSKVHGCPRFSFYETTSTQLPFGPRILDYEVEAETEENLCSHLNTDQSDMGETKWRPSLEKQQSTTGSPNFTRDTQQTRKEIVEEDIVPKMPKKTNLSHDSKFHRQQIVQVRVEEGDSSDTIHPSSITSKMVPIHMSPILTVVPTGFNNPASDKIFEEEVEEEGGLLTTRRHRSGIKAETSLLEEEPKTSIHGDPFEPCAPIISSEQTSLRIWPSKAPTSVEQTPLSSPSESTCGMPQTAKVYFVARSATDLIYGTDGSNLQPDEFMHGKSVQGNVEATNQALHNAVDTVQVSSHLVDHDVPEMLPSFYETNSSVTVPGVQEIVDMMKLEGVEASMLVEAFKTHPQLCLSMEDRSTWMLCISYRVLLNILNILATRTPFTITEADQRSLVQNLKDASVLGFDKDWLESVKSKVFNCNASEVHSLQEVLKGLDDKLKTNKIELANVRDQEVKVARAIEVAQKELEEAQKENINVRIRHSQLLEEREEILEQRDQCWKTIATKFRHFGF